MDIAEFLLARIAEDQDAAQVEWDWMIERHGPDFWTTGEGAPFDQEWMYETDRDCTLHISPRRVLAECEAKRRIVEEIAPRIDVAEDRIADEWGGFDDISDSLLRLLAAPYAAHPDYDQAWSVTASV